MPTPTTAESALRYSPQPDDSSYSPEVIEHLDLQLGPETRFVLNTVEGEFELDLDD